VCLFSLFKENKDRSIFRKNIGRALLSQNNDSFLDQWNIDLTKKKDREQYANQINMIKKIEVEISHILRENFSFCVIPVEEKDQRHFFESKIIATVAQCRECQPSKNWLGLNSPEKKIRESGLWNYQHIHNATFSNEEFGLLKQKILKT